MLNSNPANGAQIDINTYSGATNQKFILDKQTDGSYRIRTALTGNRPLDLAFGNTSNGGIIGLYDNTDLPQQRWYFIPTDNGWYQIAPKFSTDACIDISGGPGATSNGTLVQNWAYLGGTNQQWQLTQISTSTTSAFTPQTLSSKTTTSTTKGAAPTKNPSAPNS
ncbi:hypothetical protein IAD21_04330 [Abditibacteriota bacterium]|nr:hypothetical protein IAD21_04330 [Abditibacteriota bacterium]